MIVVDLQTVFLLLDDNESQFSSLPESIDLTEMLKQLLVPNPQSEFAKDNNSSVNEVLQHGDFIKSFASIQWRRILNCLGTIWSPTQTNNIREKN